MNHTFTSAFLVPHSNPRRNTKARANFFKFLVIIADGGVGNTRDVLEKVAALPITTWRYKGSTNGLHLGPVAQDFAATFALGDSDKHIATVDADGVALAAIQGLNQIVTEQQSALRARAAEVQTLQERLEKLERLVADLAAPRKEEAK